MLGIQHLQSDIRGTHSHSHSVPSMGGFRRGSGGSGESGSLGRPGSMESTSRPTTRREPSPSPSPPLGMNGKPTFRHGFNIIHSENRSAFAHRVEEPEAIKFRQQVQDEDDEMELEVDEIENDL